MLMKNFVRPSSMRPHEKCGQDYSLTKLLQFGEEISDKVKFSVLQFWVLRYYYLTKSSIS